MKDIQVVQSLPVVTYVGQQKDIWTYWPLIFLPVFVICVLNFLQGLCHRLC
jgi:hypothetical protein